METSRYQGWRYRAAAERARLEAAILIAADMENVPAEIVTVHDAARLLGVPRGQVCRRRESATARRR